MMEMWCYLMIDDILFGAPKDSDFYVNGMGGVLICIDGNMHEKAN